VTRHLEMTAMLDEVGDESVMNVKTKDPDCLFRP
jgi:hypothetical protein